MASVTELCGWLIRGDAARPCVKKPGHKDGHRATRQDPARLREYRQANASKISEQRRKYRQVNAEQIAERMREYYQANRESALEKQREYNRVNAEQIAEKTRTRNFGVPAGWYEQQLERQGFKCAICPRTESGGHGRFHVDHDHTCCPGKKSCGKCVRGLLCHGCNTSLGGFQDNAVLLHAALSYLAMYAV